jgi:hypothetical protein
MLDRDWSARARIEMEESMDTRLTVFGLAALCAEAKLHSPLPAGGSRDVNGVVLHFVRPLVGPVATEF